VLLAVWGGIALPAAAAAAAIFALMRWFLALILVCTSGDECQLEELVSRGVPAVHKKKKRNMVANFEEAAVRDRIAGRYGATVCFESVVALQSGGRLGS
jgi:hypothetical protein